MKASMRHRNAVVSNNVDSKQARRHTLSPPGATGPGSQVPRPSPLDAEPFAVRKSATGDGGPA
jgi:hypothetical protein